MESAFRNTWTYFLLAIVVLALCVGAFAQGSGELSGLVTDSTGAVVSGVQVKLTNSATGEVRNTVTTPSGIYSFPALPIVGSYALEVAAKGFKSTKVQNVIVSVGAITTRDVKLEVGAATEQVTVEAGAQIVQTEDSSLSQLVDRRVWEDMPIEARNANDFINLVAGAVPEQQAGGTFRGASVNGTRTGTGNFMVEGLDNNEQGQGGAAICGTSCGQGGSNTSVSPEAIEEYRVITHDFSAEYGKAGGFVTDTVLKSGTNQWHGSLYEYNRIQALTAEDWFTNAGVSATGGRLKDHLVRNQFGGSIGGPIVKDKTFFYATVEEHRLRETAPVTGTSITQQFYNWVDSGAMATFVNSVAPCSNNGGCPNLPTQLGTNFKALQAKFPLAVPLVNSSINCLTTTNPACFSSDAYGSNFFGVLPEFPVPLTDTTTLEQNTPINQFRFSVKMDHNFNANDRLSGTYLLENVTSDLNFGANSAFSGPEHNPNRAQTAGITWTHTFSPTLLNQFKIGYVRRTANFFEPGMDGIPDTYAFDPTTIDLGSATNLPQFFTENQFEFKDDISLTKGKHQLKFGEDYRRTRNGSDFPADIYGHFANWGTEDMVTDGVFTDAIESVPGLSAGYGYPGGVGSWYYAAASVNPSNLKVPDTYRGYRADEVGLYAQDDWRVNSRLTLNLGLRWDYFGPPHNFRPNIDSNVYFGSPVTPFCNAAVPPCTNPDFLARITNNTWYANEASARFEVRNNSIWNKDTNDFGPRFGFAWDTLGNQKMVVRGAFGTFYDRLYNNVFENIRFNAPFYADNTAGIFASGTPLGALKDPGLYAVPFTANAAFASVPGAKPVPRHMDQNMRAAYYMQESFGIEYAVAKDMALEANYVGTLGRRLIGILNRNTFDGRVAGGGSTRPNPIFNNDNARGNYFNSDYNALNVTLRKRFSHGLSMNANYTYSKALDELSDAFRQTANGASFPGPPDVENLRYNYGPADFDIRHRIVVSYNYDLPVFKGNKLLGGWTLNGIVSWNTGSPIGFVDTTGAGTDANKDGTRSDRPSVVGNATSSIIGKEMSVGGKGIYQYLDATPSTPATGYALKGIFGPSAECMFISGINTHGGRWCDANLGRNAVPGPSFANVDFGISKSFKINERMGFRFDANFFDLLNHPNFENPGRGGNGGNDFGNGAFGQSGETFGSSGGHRVTQLAIRFDF